MKNLTWMLLFVLLIYGIFSNDSIMSKFHQNVYKLKDLRTELYSYDKNYFNIFEIKTYKYNRTTPAVNIAMNMKVTVKDKLEILVQCRKFLSNEYRYFPVRFQVSLKSMFDSNVGGMKAATKCGNVTNVYFEKNRTYYICNFTVDETFYPPLIPNGRYRVDHQVLYLDKEIAMVYAFGEVYTPIPYPKN